MFFSVSLVHQYAGRKVRAILHRPPSPKALPSLKADSLTSVSEGVFHPFSLILSLLAFPASVDKLPFWSVCAAFKNG